MRRRNYSRQRPQTPRARRVRLLVVCGGIRTEPAYLKGLRHRVGNGAVDVTVVPRSTSPLQIVRYADRYRIRSDTDFDEVWCVVDVDDFDILTTAELDRTLRVEIAVSNPCFELWLLLHHEDCRTHLAGYHAVVKRLRKHVPAYDKSTLNFADYVTGVSAAIDRGEALDPTGTDHTRNPSTSVWRLVGRITTPPTENR